VATYFAVSKKGINMAKNFEFINKSALKTFMALPEDIRLQFSADLNAVCQGERPFSDFKDVSTTVGTGTIELIENGSPAYRTLYCAKYLDTVFILHAFTKTTNGVDRRAMDTAQKRYSEMMQVVRERLKAAAKTGKLQQGNTSNKSTKKH
jgi:phage-related protein